ncbi:MAG TPA: hypothetical protein VMM13_14535 [Euzebya sp.]|nr:hypothetical protein [Euzebya sp.]
MTPELRDLLAEELRTHGAVRRDDALALGLTDGDLAAAVLRGELRRERTGNYVSTAVRESRIQTIRQDVAAMRPRAYAAGAAALCLHDPDQRIVVFRREILIPSLNGPERPVPPIVHRTRYLPAEDVTTVADIRTTTIRRTVVDLAARLSLVDRLSLLDRVIMKGLTSQADMFERASDLANGRCGVSDLAEATRPDAAAVFFSKLERLGAPLLMRAGLEDVQFNVVPRRAPGAKRCDAVSEKYKTVVEWDGLRFHSSPEARQADNLKGNALAGRYHLLRFTWRDVMDRAGYVIATTARVTT